MMWCDFFDKFYDWSESTVRSRISALEDIGTSEEVVEVVISLTDEKAKVQLVRKALKMGVRFTHEDFCNLDGELPDELYAEIAEREGFCPQAPYFDEHNFTWDEFCAACGELPTEMLMRCISRITEFGNSEEVVEAIEMLCDSDVQDALFERAVACNVKFSSEQMEQLGRVDDGSLFLVDEIKAVNALTNEEIDRFGVQIKKLSVKLDVNTVNMQRKKVKTVPRFGALLGAIGAGLFGGLLGEKGRRKHSGRCEGDCANCPRHFGYRYGRWYYGHGHNYGCVFGGNKGGGGPD